MLAFFVAGQVPTSEDEVVINLLVLKVGTIAFIREGAHKYGVIDIVVFLSLAKPTENNTKSHSFQNQNTKKNMHVLKWKVGYLEESELCVLNIKHPL